MRSKRRRKSIYNLKCQDSEKQICSGCNKLLIFEDLKQIRRKKYYRALCKSAKCLIHKNITRFENCVKSRAVESRLLKNMVPGRKCRIKEFEDSEKSQTKINASMFSYIQGLMEKISLEDTQFENTLAQNSVKEAINRTVIWPLNKPKIFKGLRTAPKGILLFGPSGVGKSIMGKHIAYETNASFFYLQALEFKTRWPNNNKDFVRTLFLVAKARQPSIIFINDVDTLFSQKALYESKSNMNLKNEFLFCMDSAEKNSEDRILVIAATKKPFDLDQEIMIRFSKKFFVSLPDKTSRKNLLEKLLEHECHSLEYRDIEDLASKTEGHTVEEIKQMSREAAMNSLMSLPAKEINNLELAIIKPISAEDFLTALRIIKPSVSKETLKAYENWDIEYGYGGQLARKTHKSEFKGDPIYVLIPSSYKFRQAVPSLRPNKRNWNGMLANKFGESTYIL